MARRKRVAPGKAAGRKQAPRREPPISDPKGEVGEFWRQYVREANEALAVVRGEEARWWIYSVSHRTFELVVGDPMGRTGNIVLQARGCVSIAGKMSWITQDLEVVYSGPAYEHAYELRDEAAGFRVIAAAFRWDLDVDLLNREVEIGLLR